MRGFTGNEEKGVEDGQRGNTSVDTAGVVALTVKGILRHESTRESARREGSNGFRASGTLICVHGSSEFCNYESNFYATVNNTAFRRKMDHLFIWLFCGLRYIGNLRK